MMFKICLCLTLIIFIETTNAIEGGCETVRTDYEFIGSLQKSGHDTGLDHICQVTILSELFAITACSCFFDEYVLMPDSPVEYFKHRDYSEYSIKYSGNDLYSKNLRTCRILEVIPHDEFTLNPLTNNLCLMKVDHFEIGVLAQAVHLQSPNYNVTPNTLGWVAGWGAVTIYGVYRSNLRDCLLPVASDTPCFKMFGFDNYNSNREFCYGEPCVQVGVCTGDIGAPVLLPDKHTLIGVVSRIDNLDCTHQCIVTRISYYLPWICKITNILVNVH